MGMPWSDMIQSGTDMTTTFFGNAQNFHTNKWLQGNAFTQQNELNATAREWAEKMSNSAHQREVEDLRKAGLNPILSVNSGASTPNVSGGSGFGQNVKLDTPKLNLLDNMLKAVSVENAKKQNQVLEKQIEGMAADNRINSARADVDASGWGKFLYGAGKFIDVANGLSTLVNDFTTAERVMKKGDSHIGFGRPQMNVPVSKLEKDRRNN